MKTTSAAPLRPAAPARREHDRQRARVLASLLLTPGRDKPTHRRWA